MGVDETLWGSRTVLPVSLFAGECFCVLGPNGAGKSTTINCLTGVLPTTAGEAVVHGSSITHQGGLDSVRGQMGVCPQFDVLWDNLTGREHLLLFGAIKGLDGSQAEKQADALLEQVMIPRPHLQECGWAAEVAVLQQLLCTLLILGCTLSANRLE